MNHGGLKRARSRKRRIQPKKAYSSSGLLYSENCFWQSVRAEAFTFSHSFFHPFSFERCFRFRSRAATASLGI